MRPNIKKITKIDDKSVIMEVDFNNKKCNNCDIEINRTETWIAITNDLKEKTLCESCLKLMITSNNIIFYDTLEFYQKRKKSGFIDNLIKNRR